MTRIKPRDTLMDSIAKVAENNPGGLRVCIELVRDGGDIDPDSALGGFGNILSLDQLGIYGSRIWMLYKDACGEDLMAMIGVLRALQLGFLSDIALKHAIDNYGEGIDCALLLREVRKTLPNFRKASAQVKEEKE